MSDSTWEERVLELWDTPLPLTASEEERRAYIERCKGAIVDLKAGIRGILVEERRAEKARRYAETEATSWDRKSELAERAGDPILRDEARAASAASRREAEQAGGYESERRAWTNAFRAALKELFRRESAIRQTLAILVTRYPRRDRPVGTGNAFETFERMAARIDDVPFELEKIEPPPPNVGPWVHRFDDGKPRMAILSVVDDEVRLEERPIDPVAAPHETVGGSQPLAEVLSRPHPIWDAVPHARLLVRVAVLERGGSSSGSE